MTTRVRTWLLLAVAGLAGCAPAAWAARPKLYKVSLQGDVRKQEMVVSGGDPPPLGCIGESTLTHRFAASAGLTAKPFAGPIASYGRLRFRALLASPSVTSTTESAGSWTPDPYLPPDDPSVCVFKPETKSWPCSFATEATRPTGGEYALYPKKGKYQLYYNRSAGILSCDDEYIDPSLLNPVTTTLRVSAVKRLARGAAASASGTVMTPPLAPGATDGGETLHYSLTVARVR